MFTFDPNWDSTQNVLTSLRQVLLSTVVNLKYILTPNKSPCLLLVNPKTIDLDLQTGVSQHSYLDRDKILMRRYSVRRTGLTSVQILVLPGYFCLAHARNENPTAISKISPPHLTNMRVQKTF